MKSTERNNALSGQDVTPNQPQTHLGDDSQSSTPTDRAANAPRDGQDATRKDPPFVLVVDDHIDTREGYAEYLRMAGFRTAQAASGVGAITLARSMQPDAIVLDYAMPMMDGVQAAIVLKRDAQTSTIPIVMLTAFGDIVNGRGGCDYYLDKPCDPRDVVAKLRSVLHMDDESS